MNPSDSGAEDVSDCGDRDTRSTSRHQASPLGASNGETNTDAEMQGQKVDEQASPDSISVELEPVCQRSAPVSQEEIGNSDSNVGESLYRSRLRDGDIGMHSRGIAEAGILRSSPLISDSLLLNEAACKPSDSVTVSHSDANDSVSCITGDSYAGSKHIVDEEVRQVSSMTDAFDVPGTEKEQAVLQATKRLHSPVSDTSALHANNDKKTHNKENSKQVGLGRIVDEEDKGEDTKDGDLGGEVNGKHHHHHDDDDDDDHNDNNITDSCTEERIAAMEQTIVEKLPTQPYSQSRQRVTAGSSFTSSVQSRALPSAQSSAIHHHFSAMNVRLDELSMNDSAYNNLEQLRALSGDSNRGGPSQDSNSAGGSHPLVAELAQSPDQVRHEVRQQLEEEYQHRLEEQLQQRIAASGGEALQATAVVAEPLNATSDASDHDSTSHLNSRAGGTTTDLSNRRSRIDARTPTHTEEDVAIPGKSEKDKKRVYCVIVMAVVAVLGIAVGLHSLSLVRTKNGNQSGKSRNATSSSSSNPGNVSNADSTHSASPSLGPTQAPTMPLTLHASGDSVLTETFLTLLDLMEPVLVLPPTSTSEATLVDPSTIQYRVLDWMANNDAASEAILADQWSPEYTLRQLLDRYALTCIFLATNGLNWTFTEQFMTDKHVCDWNDAASFQNGVWCDNDDTVRAIMLRGNNLEGELPDELYLLDVGAVDFSQNPIVGTLSTSLGLLSNMNSFRASMTMISGSIPTEIGHLTGLSFLSIYDAQLSGSIPTEIGSCTNLVMFEVDQNDMTGTIPSEMGLMTMLRHMMMSHNDLVGTVPKELGGLSGLAYFEIDDTSITGDLDSIFCVDGAGPFPFMESFWSDCWSTPSVPPNTACSCCTGCCANGTDCGAQELLASGSCSDGSCVSCANNVFAASCELCLGGNIRNDLSDGGGDNRGSVALATVPTDPIISGPNDRVCWNACAVNTTTGICEKRTEFGRGSIP